MCGKLSDAVFVLDAEKKKLEDEKQAMADEVRTQGMRVRRVHETDVAVCQPALVRNCLIRVFCLEYISHFGLSFVGVAGVEQIKRLQTQNEMLQSSLERRKGTHAKTHALAMSTTMEQVSKCTFLRA